MAPHSSTLAWKIPWMEEPVRLQSMGSRRVVLDWAISLSLFTVMRWRRQWQPTPVFLPGESQGRGGAWWAAVYGVAQSWTRLKRLGSSIVKWSVSTRREKKSYQLEKAFTYVWERWIHFAPRRGRKGKKFGSCHYAFGVTNYDMIGVISFLLPYSECKKS